MTVSGFLSPLTIHAFVQFIRRFSYDFLPLVSTKPDPLNKTQQGGVSNAAIQTSGLKLDDSTVSADDDTSWGSIMIDSPQKQVSAPPSTMDSNSLEEMSVHHNSMDLSLKPCNDGVLSDVLREVPSGQALNILHPRAIKSY